MLNRLAVILLLSAVVSDSGQKNQGANLAHHNSDNQSAQAPLFVNQVSQSTPNEKAANNEPPHWYASPEWWLVILGFPTLGFIGWQAKETRKAAQATREAAIATAKSADATLTAERAWIIGTLPNVPEWVPEENRLEFLFLSPLFKNYGRTPGRIMRIRSRTHYLAESETLPPEPSYEAEKWHVFRIDAEIVLPSDAAVQPLEIKLGSLTFRNVLDRKLRLYVYWQVDYRDVFGFCWYDRSCYEFHISSGFDPKKQGFYVSGAVPKAYNASAEKPQDCPK